MKHRIPYLLLLPLVAIMSSCGSSSSPSASSSSGAASSSQSATSSIDWNSDYAAVKEAFEEAYTNYTMKAYVCTEFVAGDEVGLVKNVTLPEKPVHTYLNNSDFYLNDWGEYDTSDAGELRYEDGELSFYSYARWTKDMEWVECVDEHLGGYEFNNRMTGYPPEVVTEDIASGLYQSFVSDHLYDLDLALLTHYDSQKNLYCLDTYYQSRKSIMIHGVDFSQYYSLETKYVQNLEFRIEEGKITYFGFDCSYVDWNDKVVVQHFSFDNIGSTTRTIFDANIQRKHPEYSGSKVEGTYFNLYKKLFDGRNYTVTYDMKWYDNPPFVFHLETKVDGLKSSVENDSTSPLSGTREHNHFIRVGESGSQYLDVYSRILVEGEPAYEHERQNYNEPEEALAQMDIDTQVYLNYLYNHQDYEEFASSMSYSTCYAPDLKAYYGDITDNRREKIDCDFSEYGSNYKLNVYEVENSYDNVIVYNEDGTVKEIAEVRRTYLNIQGDGQDGYLVKRIHDIGSTTIDIPTNIA